jgi:hypothetical protein
MSATQATPPDTMEQFLERCGSKAVTYKALNSVLDTTQAEFIKVLRKQRDTITALEARIAQLEARPPGVEYDGLYENGKAYTKGVLVSRKGGLWLSLKDENAWAPGQSPLHWKLVVKSGDGER